MSVNDTRPRRGLLYVLAPLAAALILAGCASTRGLEPSGRALDADSLQAKRSVAVADLSAAQFPQRDWWTAFGDAQLDRLVDDALAGAPTLQAQRERVAQALADADVENAALLPQLGATASAVPTRLPGSYRTPPPAAGHWQVDAQALLGASWDLDIAGRQHALARAAALRADQQRALERAAAVSLQAAIVETYLQLALEQRLLAIARDTQCARDLDRRSCLSHLTLALARRIEARQDHLDRHLVAHAQIDAVQHEMLAAVGLREGFAHALHFEKRYCVHLIAPISRGGSAARRRSTEAARRTD